MMIKTVCVCGAGTMGSGIAQVSAQAGFVTIQYDVNEEMLHKSRAGIENNLGKLLAKGRISEADKNDCLSRILFTSKAEQCVADLVIEAIIEDKQAKIDLFNHLATYNNPDTIFATNTSSLPVTAIASGTSQPGKVIGLHFFNPAPLMKLVEVVAAVDTEKRVIDSITALAKAMGKTPVLCIDSPGFIVNRVARPYYLEAMKMLEEGLADITTIDALMQSAGFKMGPFALMDLIGMDINYHVSNIVWEALDKPERLTPSPVQKAKLDSGELGRKTGKGFYQY